MAFYYTQYNSTPSTGLSYLSGDIMPWDDYIIMRTDEYTTVSIYGTCDDDLFFDTCTVRTVFRDTESGYGSTYYATEETLSDVYVRVSNPYYAYGNVIGVNYNLPAAQNVTALAVCSAVVVCSLISVFRLVWSLKRGTVK